MMDAIKLHPADRDHVMGIILERAYREGAKSFKDGNTPCPYDPRQFRQQFEEWMRGYRGAKREAELLKITPVIPNRY